MFDETLFPHCPDGKQWTFTEIGDQPPPKNRYPEDLSDPSDDNNFGDHPLFPLENDGDTPPSSPPSKNNDPRVPDTENLDHPSQTQGRPQLPRWQGPEQPVAPRRGMRQQTVKSQPDNINGNHTPTDLQCDDLWRRAGNQPDSSRALPNPGSGSIPGSSQAPPPSSGNRWGNDTILYGLVWYYMKWHG